MKPARHTAAERIAKRINREIKTGAVDAALIATVISGVDLNQSHPIHVRILAEAKKEQIL